MTSRDLLMIAIGSDLGVLTMLLANFAPERKPRIPRARLAELQAELANSTRDFVPDAKPKLRMTKLNNVKSNKVDA